MKGISFELLGGPRGGGKGGGRGEAIFRENNIILNAKIVAFYQFCGMVFSQEVSFNYLY